MTPYALLKTYLRPWWPRTLLLFLLLGGGIAAQLINPQILRAFIDTATGGGSQRALLRAALAYLALAAAQQVLQTAASYVSEDVGWRATNRLRADLTAHCLRLDMSFHNAHTPGELIERVDGDVSTLATFFSQLVVQVWGNGLLALGILILLWREDWRVGLVGTAYALLLAGFLRGIQRRSVRLMTAARQAQAALIGFLEEAFVSLEDIHANGGDAYLLRRFYELARQVLLTMRRASMMTETIFTATYLLYTFTLCAVLVIGAVLLRQGVMTIGGLFLVVTYVTQLETPLSEIRRQVTRLHEALAGVQRIGEFLRLRPAIANAGAARLPPGPLSVTFDSVTFSYEARPTVTDVRFHLAAGQVLGLLGRTGSGKTTLGRLLFRLYDVDAGTIRLHGTDLRQLDLSHLRGRVGMVTQEVQLFAATVRDNVTFFDHAISDERILAALAELGLANWLAGLPHGLDTPVAAGGKGLSAGEGQLLAFARIFLKDPGLIILDEASSRLDPATERRLDRAISRLIQGRTAIIIAHRLATIQRTDQVLILSEGRVAEFGPRAALAADTQSRFYRLLHAQEWRSGENKGAM